MTLLFNDLITAWNAFLNILFYIIFPLGKAYPKITRTHLLSKTRNFVLESLRAKWSIREVARLIPDWFPPTSGELVKSSTRSGSPRTQIMKQALKSESLACSAFITLLMMWKPFWSSVACCVEWDQWSSSLETVWTIYYVLVHPENMWEPSKQGESMNMIPITLICS